MIRFFSLSFILALISLSGCDLYEEGHITPNRVQIEETKFVEEIPSAQLDVAAVAHLARNYARHGDGPLDLTITYDPASRVNTAMVASNHASRISTVFRKQGVPDVSANIIPVNGQGDTSMAVVSYVSYNALPPKDCELLPGIEDTDIRTEEDYRLGCSVETLFARQIARPKDLKGRDSSGVTDGRRSNNIVERYRTGTSNEALEGQTASE